MKLHELGRNTALKNYLCNLLEFPRELLFLHLNLNSCDKQAKDLVASVKLDEFRRSAAVKRVMVT